MNAKPPKKQQLNYRLGKSLPLGFTLLGIVLIFVSFMIWYEGFEWFWMILLFIPGGALVFSWSGIIIDLQKNQLKRYSWVYFFKIGKWENLDRYPDILVMRSNESRGYGSNGLPSMWVVSGIVTYWVELASHNHISRVLVKQFNNKEQAYLFARELSSLTCRDWVRYNPGKRNNRQVLP